MRSKSAGPCDGNSSSVAKPSEFSVKSAPMNLGSNSDTEGEASHSDVQDDCKAVGKEKLDLELYGTRAFSWHAYAQIAVWCAVTAFASSQMTVCP